MADGGWNFADVWEAHAEDDPDRTAIVHGPRRLSWRQLQCRAHRLAGALAGEGLRPGSKVAQYLPNTPEYLEAVFASFQGRFVPVNTNYRYQADELVQLWANADVEAVVFHLDFSDRVGVARHRIGTLRTLVGVGDRGRCPTWATPYEELLTDNNVAPSTAPRSGDDLLLLYTGGTTGLPKGVMWRQDDLYHLINRPDAPADGPPPVGLPACPLMHGTGLFNALHILSRGGTVVLLPSRSFDAVELLDTIDQERVDTLALVGDAHGRPVVDALDAHPGRWTLDSLRLVISSGVMMSPNVKARLLAPRPQLKVVDVLGSSEAVGVAGAVSGGRDVQMTASFRPGPNTVVLGDDNRVVVPGSGMVGRLAISGRLPLGYYKDPDQSEATFPVVDGVRYSVPGDLALVSPDGSIRLLGRGSQCINTGGEKVFAEEVEEALKGDDRIIDAAVVGVPDDRLGERVCALVVVRPGISYTLEDMRVALRPLLAGYKAPKVLLRVPTLGRLANGKLDYSALRRSAIDMAESVPSGSEAQ